jgi:hypothetical protein
MSVFKRKDRKERPWSFKFILEGELHKQCGFSSRREAQDAEDNKRKELKKRKDSITFEQAVKSRLKYLRAYCSFKHYRDNAAILQRFSEWTTCASKI